MDQFEVVGRVGELHLGVVTAGTMRSGALKHEA